MKEEFQITVKAINTMAYLEAIINTTIISPKNLKKLNNFVDLMMKVIIKNEQISFKEKNGILSVSFKEAKVSYKIIPNLELVNVTIKGARTRG